MTKEEALAIIKKVREEYRSSCDYKICEYCKECIVEKLDGAVSIIETCLAEVD